MGRHLTEGDVSLDVQVGQVTDFHNLTYLHFTHTGPSPRGKELSKVTIVSLSKLHIEFRVSKDLNLTPLSGLKDRIWGLDPTPCMKCA